MIRDVLAVIGAATVLVAAATVVAVWFDNIRHPRYTRQCLRCGKGWHSAWRWDGAVRKRWHRRPGGECEQRMAAAR